MNMKVYIVTGSSYSEYRMIDSVYLDKSIAEEQVKLAERVYHNGGWEVEEWEVRVEKPEIWTLIFMTRDGEVEFVGKRLHSGPTTFVQSSLMNSQSNTYLRIFVRTEDETKAVEVANERRVGFLEGWGDKRWGDNEILRQYLYHSDEDSLLHRER